MEDRVGNPAEVSKDAVAIYWRGESLFANLKLSLMATQGVFWSHLIVGIPWSGKTSRVYLCARACVHQASRLSMQRIVKSMLVPRKEELILRASSQARWNEHVLLTRPQTVSTNGIYHLLDDPNPVRSD